MKKIESKGKNEDGNDTEMTQTKYIFIYITERNDYKAHGRRYCSLTHPLFFRKSMFVI